MRQRKKQNQLWQEVARRFARLWKPHDFIVLLVSLELTGVMFLLIRIGHPWAAATVGAFESILVTYLHLTKKGSGVDS